MSSDTASVDFARRVAHFDIQESDKSDDDDDSGGAGGVSSAAMGRSGRAGSKARADDIEKEYLMGGGGERTGSGWGGADDEDAAMNASEGACSCNNRCGGNEKSSRIEGRNILLTVTILSMATAGFLLYSSFSEWNATNRRTICIIGIAIGAVAELCGIVGLIGLCRFSDTDKIPFKAGYWLNLIQLWANAGYFAFLLFLWDGKYDSGTMALAGPAAAAPAAVEGGAAAAAAVKAAAAFIELSVVAGAAGGLGLSAAAAPAQGQSMSAKMLSQFNAVVGTQIWFLGLSAGLILFSLLYAYGSLRLRCKKMGKWGTAITGILLGMTAMATLAFSALAIRYNTSLRDLNHLLPLGGQMAVAALILATVFYELYVSTQVQKLKLAAKSNFTTLLIMTLVAAVLVGCSHYTYYLSLKATPRIDLLSLTALSGIASQVLLFGFGVQMMAWRYALPDEYPSLPAVEKFGGPASASDEHEVFIPPTEY